MHLYHLWKECSSNHIPRPKGYDRLSCLSTYVFDTSAHPVCVDMIRHQLVPLCYCRPSENSRRYYCIMGQLNAWFWLAASDWTRCAIIFCETHGECCSRHTFTRFLSLPIFLITKFLTALVCYQQLKLPLLGLKWYGISNRAIGWDAEEINLDVLRCGNHSISRRIDSRSFNYIKKNAYHRCVHYFSNNSPARRQLFHTNDALYTKMISHWLMRHEVIWQCCIQPSTNIVSQVSFWSVCVHVFWRRRGFGEWFAGRVRSYAFKAIASLSEITYL